MISENFGIIYLEKFRNGISCIQCWILRCIRYIVCLNSLGRYCHKFSYSKLVRGLTCNTCLGPVSIPQSTLFVFFKEVFHLTIFFPTPRKTIFCNTNGFRIKFWRFFFYFLITEITVTIMVLAMEVLFFSFLIAPFLA